MTESLAIPLIIRALGRGKKGTRDLTAEESYFVMKNILTEQITAPQLGAFLMLMRVKEETSEEITGMVRATEDYLNFTPTKPIDINWPAYAGKKKQPSWYILSALLLAKNGYSVLLHGGGEHTEGRQYARAVCDALGINVVSTLAEAETHINQHKIAYISIADFLPKMSVLIDMKAELGLRSPVNTLVRHINPLQASTTLQGMFHPGYMPLHHHSAIALGQNNNIVIKGDGGEFEVRPDSETRYATNKGVVEIDRLLAPVLTQRAIRPENVTVEPLIALWNNTTANDYGLAAVTETAAVIISQHEGCSLEDAQKTARQWWDARDSL
jgi:anthranilate phosphoribosyltransferase